MLAIHRVFKFLRLRSKNVKVLPAPVVIYFWLSICLLCIGTYGPMCTSSPRKSSVQHSFFHNNFKLKKMLYALFSLHHLQQEGGKSSSLNCRWCFQFSNINLTQTKGNKGGFALRICCSNEAQFPYSHTNRMTTHNAPADSRHVTVAIPKISFFKFCSDASFSVKKNNCF